LAWGGVLGRPDGEAIEAPSVLAAHSPSAPGSTSIVVSPVHNRYAVLSCHAERPLDDTVWTAYRSFQERWPVASLLRPPAPEADEPEEPWVERARQVRLLGHHTHWGGIAQARPVGGGDPGARVRREGAWLRERSLEPRFFCAGGWYFDAQVAAAVADLGYVDASATTYALRYLDPGAPHLRVDGPSWLALPDGRRLLELPATHSAGMLVRALARPLPRVVHVHFHDWELVNRRFARALDVALRVLRARRRLVGLDELAVSAAVDAPVVDLDFRAGG
jgi:hypothetical protein